ncbi:hypothetical protein MMC28_008155 [Mycoblastus sanguinarius]|nr:hypothetical protein [Mycoblastus sanguinarius]
MSQASPTEVVSKLLANTLSPAVINELVAPDATYISLNYGNTDLTKILPYAGTHAKAGPQAIIDTFATVNKIWTNEAFEIQALFGTGENVAVFGRFTYRSNTLGKACESPFSIWCKVDAEGKVTGGNKKYNVFKEKGEFEV